MGLADDADPATKVIRYSVCAGCGCVCDDVEVTVEGFAVVGAKNACELGQRWFYTQGIEERPVASIEGRPATFDAAVQRAADILLQAKYPLVFGLSQATVDAQRAAVELADWAGGVLDTTASLHHGGGVMALQSVGEVTCTLGEIRNRADLVVFWGVDPAVTHPRFLERYAKTPTGRFLAEGAAGRTVVLIDAARTKSAEAADLFLQITPGKDFEALWALRGLVKGVDLDPAIEAEIGIPFTQMQHLAERMKSAKYGVLLVGAGLCGPVGTHLTAEAAFLLVQDLNAYTCFTVKAMTGAGGAENVVAWQTGYPFAVHLGSGFPRSNPGEFSAVDVLARQEADAALMVAADPLSDFPQPALDHLLRIPMICLDSKATQTANVATVSFATSVPGINTPGAIYRMDDVLLPLRPAFESPFPAAEQILMAITAAVRRASRPEFATP